MIHQKKRLVLHFSTKQLLLPVPSINSEAFGDTTAENAFTPITYDNIAKTNESVPEGTSGCYVTLIGAGGGGGGGSCSHSAARAGGGGGGGGAIIPKFIDVSLLDGNTWSISKGTGGTSGAGGGTTGNTGRRWW